MSGRPALASAARRYWASVFPEVRREVRRWRAHASSIGDPQLRHDALVALGKRGNLEGAAAFATFAPRRQRRAVVRASVAFQAAYDYLDVLSERPHHDAIGNATRLNAALIAAVRPATNAGERALAHDFYAQHGRSDDGGYLARLIVACRQALAGLPSLAAVAGTLERAAERAARFQALNVPQAAGEPGSELRPLAEWAAALPDQESGLAWWELAAGAGSSLGVHALIAAAARADLDSATVTAIEQAYFPSVGALHSLLDQLVDIAEDERAGIGNIARCYRTREEAAHAYARLAARARSGAQTLDAAGIGSDHLLLLCAMAANYLEQPQARAADAAPARAAVLAELGPLARAAIAVFRIKRVCDAL